MLPSVAALAIAGLIALTAASAAARAGAPLPAHGTFVSHTYSFTVRVPDGLTYCRLEDDWSGSDHGTILFLTPPLACYGTGYPSSSRGFTPESTPRIELYYSSWMPDVDTPIRCRRIGQMEFLGRARPLCRASSNGMMEVSVTGYYTADGPALAILSLVTTAARLYHDLPILRALVRTARVCSVPWHDAQGRTRFTGSGRSCPANGDFY